MYTHKRKIKANSLVQHLQERNEGIQEALTRLKHELHINKQIIDRLLGEGDNSEEEYEDISIEDSLPSVEIIEPQQRYYQAARGLLVGLETPVSRVARSTSAVTTHREQESTPKTTTRKKSKQEERKESLQKASAWARDRKNYRE
jgi:hypothetical protein